MSSYEALVNGMLALAVNLSVFGAALAVGVAVAFRLIPTISPRARYTVVLAAFCVASFVPVMATLGLTTHQNHLSTLPVLAENGDPTPEADIQLNADPETLAPQPSTLLVRLTNFGRGLVQVTLVVIFPWLWLGGSLLMLVRELCGHVRLLRIRRTWRSASADLRQALELPDHIPLRLHSYMGPSTVGWLRPTLVLPECLCLSLSPAAIKWVVKHELNHARWRDPLANVLLRLVCALLWPSLPLWFLKHLAVAEREAAADQAAVAGAPAGDGTNQAAEDYAITLLHIADWHRKLPALRHCGSLTTFAFRKQSLEVRVSRLLAPAARLSLSRLVLSVAALLGVLAVAVQLPVAIAGEMVTKSEAARDLAHPHPDVPQRPADGRAPRPVLGRPAASDSQKPHAEATDIERISGRRRDAAGTSARVVFNNRDGLTKLIRKTEGGEIEESILNRTEAELVASAVNRVAPLYTEGRGRASKTEWILVFVLIDEQGDVISARVIAGSENPAAGRKAVEAARQWKFMPATMNGRPVKVFGTLSFFGSPGGSKDWIEIR